MSRYMCAECGAEKAKFWVIDIYDGPFDSLDAALKKANARHSIVEERNLWRVETSKKAISV